MWKSKNAKHPHECHKIKDIHIISGLIFKREVSCDQNSGMEPRFWTTELICMGNPSGTSSKTICSVSTSLATLPFSFTPRFKYLNREAPVRGVPMWKLIKQNNVIDIINSSSRWSNNIQYYHFYGETSQSTPTSLGLTSCFSCCCVIHSEKHHSHISRVELIILLKIRV